MRLSCNKLITFFTVPKVQFKEGSYKVDESDGEITAMVYRSGDINLRSTVRCYTRQGTAQVMMDYSERPNTDASIITFLPGEPSLSLLISPLLCILEHLPECVNHFSSGETEKPCVVSLMDDSVHEEDEEFRLVLGTPKSKSPYGASIGEQKEALVTVTDEKDSKYFTNMRNTLMPKYNLKNGSSRLIKATSFKNVCGEISTSLLTASVEPINLTYIHQKLYRIWLS